MPHICVTFVYLFVPILVPLTYIYVLCLCTEPWCHSLKACYLGTTLLIQDLPSTSSPPLDLEVSRKLYVSSKLLKSPQRVLSHVGYVCLFVSVLKYTKKVLFVSVLKYTERVLFVSVLKYTFRVVSCKLCLFVSAQSIKSLCMDEWIDLFGGKSYHSECGEWHKPSYIINFV